MPCPGIGTQRSRGIDSMVAFFEVGSTRMRIIDCVFTRSCANFASSSDPSSRTVKGSVVVGNGFGTAIGSGPLFPVAVEADWNSGKKYATSPMIPASTNPATTLEARGK